MTNEDDKDWKEYLKLVKPIKKVQFTKDIFAKPKKKLLKKSLDDKDIGTFLNEEVLPSEEYTLKLGNKDGIDKNLIKKIKKGAIKIDDELDLHGQSFNHSKKLITTFVNMNLSRQKRLILIITGKGKRLGTDKGWKGTGVLKENLPSWISTTSISRKILWFDKAPHRKGGDGALLIYLRKFRE